MSVKIGWHNSCAATAASLGGAPAAAHSALISVAMLCFVLGDVGSSMSQSFLPAFARNVSTQTVQNVNSNGQGVSEPASEIDLTLNLDAAIPTIKQLLRCTLGISTTVMILAATIIGFSQILSLVTLLFWKR